MSSTNWLALTGEPSSSTTSSASQCPHASRFNLQATTPAGWAAAFAASTPSISPGAGASTTLQVTSPAATADGFYTIGVATANRANATCAASTSATYAIVSSLDVAVSTDQAIYVRNQTVTVTATVSSGGSPVSGASVTFTITKQSGATVTGSATSGTNGSAVYKYRLKTQDPVGTYQVTSDANLNNAIFGSGWKSFTVQ